MNLIALGLGLLLERLLTHLLHLREPRWLDAYFDWGFARLENGNGAVSMVGALLLVAVPVLPVAAVALTFDDVLLGAPYIAFAVLVLLFSLGPRDLSVEVDEYVAAVNRDDTETAARVAKELLESDPPRDSTRRARAIEEAIFVQASNRLFGVILWFMVLGPTGAWLFRVTDLMRRRASFKTERDGFAGDAQPGYYVVVQRVHGVIAWLPSRLVAIGYALAGSFEGAVSDWRAYYADCSEHLFEVNDDVVACAGRGALGTSPTRQSAEMHPEIRVVRSAMQLIGRTLWVWLTVISLMTIVGWSM